MSELDHPGLLARFIFDRSKIRADGTAKPDCFMPDPDRELSVTKHDGLLESEIWKIAINVADEGARTLRGRTDVAARIIEAQGLAVDPKPTESNPNHANVVGWPNDKPRQKIIAQNIARFASNVLQPPVS